MLLAFFFLVPIVVHCLRVSLISVSAPFRILVPIIIHCLVCCMNTVSVPCLLRLAIVVPCLGGFYFSLCFLCSVSSMNAYSCSLTRLFCDLCSYYMSSISVYSV